MMWITDRDIRPFRIDDVRFSAIDEADALNQPAKYIAVFSMLSTPTIFPFRITGAE